jgi:nitroimidazol reductase NimA-like FMN-containing flavoprotein (pyridoxamine 5'-phosphate oxidase superfamily)
MAERRRRNGPAPASERVRVRRRSDRADYDRATVYSILDQALVCHVGFTVDEQPYVTPTIHVREGDTLYLHGHSKNRMLKVVGSGAPVCIEATLVDAMVFGRSRFMNALNYRSVVALGRARLVEDEAERWHAVQLVVSRMLPAERVPLVRDLADYEVKQTAVVAFPLDECSAKIRSGPGVDEERDLANDVWAGEIPLRMVGDTPVGDEHVREGTDVPEHVTSWAERWGARGGLTG